MRVDLVDMNLVLPSSDQEIELHGVSDHPMVLLGGVAYLLVQGWLLVLCFPGSLILNLWIGDIHGQLGHSVCDADAGCRKTYHC